MTPPSQLPVTADDIADLRRRVIALEAEVARLKERLNTNPALEQIGPRWWRHVVGAFADDPSFDEAARLGREWREAQRAEAIAQADAEDAVEAMKSLKSE